MGKLRNSNRAIIKLPGYRGCGDTSHCREILVSRKSVVQPIGSTVLDRRLVQSPRSHSVRASGPRPSATKKEGPLSRFSLLVRTGLNTVRSLCETGRIRNGRFEDIVTAIHRGSALRAGQIFDKARNVHVSNEYVSCDPLRKNIFTKCLKTPIRKRHER